MPQPESGRPTATFVPEETLVAVIEMSLSTWLVAGLAPGVDRRPLKKLNPNENDLLLLLDGWRSEAIAAGRTIHVSWLPTSPAVMGAGWHAGCKPEA